MADDLASQLWKQYGGATATAEPPAPDLASQLWKQYGGATATAEPPAPDLASQLWKQYGGATATAEPPAPDLASQLWKQYAPEPAPEPPMPGSSRDAAGMAAASGRTLGDLAEPATRSAKIMGRSLVQQGGLAPLQTAEALQSLATGQGSGFGQLAESIQGSLPTEQAQTAGEHVAEAVGGVAGFGLQLAAAPQVGIPRLMAGIVGAADMFGAAFHTARGKGASTAQALESALISSAGAGIAAGAGPMGKLAGPAEGPAFTQAAKVLAKLNTATKGAIVDGITLGTLGSAAQAADALGAKVYGDKDRDALREAAAAFGPNTAIGAFLGALSSARPHEAPAVPRDAAFEAKPAEPVLPGEAIPTTDVPAIEPIPEKAPLSPDIRAGGESVAPEAVSTAGPVPESSASPRSIPGESSVDSEPYSQVERAPDASPETPSKVQDVVFHETPGEPFSEFDPSKKGSRNPADQGELGSGFYFTTDGGAMKRMGRSGTQIGANVDVKNPLNIKADSWFADKKKLINAALGTEGLVGDQITKEAKRQGYDGVILDYSALGYPHQEIAVFDSNQVRVKHPPPEQAPASEAVRSSGEAAGAQKPAASPEPLSESAPRAEATPEGAGGEQGSAEPPKTTGIKNATVDAEMAAMGLEPPEHGAKTTFAEQWAKAKATLDADPRAGEKLVEDLAANNRPPRREENALFALELNRRIVERETAERALKEDPSGVAARAQVAKAREDYATAARVSALAGSESSGSLGFRRMMVARDYSLARQELVIETAKGAPLTDAERARVSDLTGRIAALEKAASELEAQGKVASERAAPKPKPTPVLDFFSAKATEARARIAERGKTVRMHAGGIETQELIDYATIGAEHIARGVNDLATWSKKMVEEFGQRIRPHLQAIYDKAVSMHATTRSEQSRLKGAKTRATKTLAELQGKVATGDLSRRPRPEPIKPDPELTRMRLQIEQHKGTLEQMRMRFDRANRTTYQKASDTFVRWSRAFVLSSPNVLVKLPAAGAWRMALTPAREAIGGAISKAIPGLASRAPIEGGMSVEAVAKGYVQGFTQGMRDAAQYLRTGKSDLETLHDKKIHLPPEGIEYLGTMHGALKSPTKRFAFEYAMQKQVEFNIRAGRDIQEPALQLQMATEAYKFAQRAIFQQDNVLQDILKDALRKLEAKQKATGKPSLPGQLASTGIQAALPVTKIPTNIVGEVIEHIIGTVTGSAQAGLAYRRGIETLPPEQADLIMRQLKNGSLGLAIMTLGYFARDSIGGYFQPGKRSEDEPKFGGLKIGGVDVPGNLIHNPTLEPLQVAATLGRVADSKERKKDTETRGVAAGAFAAAMGLLEEVPFVRETLEIGKLFDQREGQNAAGAMLGRRLVPSGVQWAASRMDTDAEGKPIKRKASGLFQSVQSGIPGLRGLLPVKQ